MKNFVNNSLILFCTFFFCSALQAQIEVKGGKIGIGNTDPKMDVHMTADSLMIENKNSQLLFKIQAANIFLGKKAGSSNTLGNGNTFLGKASGRLNTEGLSNTFIGVHTGLYNTTGNGNTFVGNATGQANIDGENNTAIGSEAAVLSAPNLSFWSALGYNAQPTKSRQVMLGATDNEEVVLQGQAVLPHYTGTNHDGTFSSILGVDEDGNVIKTDASVLDFEELWTEDAGNAYYNGGNIGIGTTNPDKKLVVNGQTRIENTGSGPGLHISGSRANLKMESISTGGVATNLIEHFLTNNSSGNSIKSGMIGAFGSATHLTTQYMYLDAKPNGAYNDAALKISGTGNIGIGIDGTTSPSEKLEVAGKTKTTDIQITTGATAGHVLQSDASGNASWVDPEGLETNNVFSNNGSLSGHRHIDLNGKVFDFYDNGYTMRFQLNGVTPQFAINPTAVFPQSIFKMKNGNGEEFSTLFNNNGIYVDSPEEIVYRNSSDANKTAFMIEPTGRLNFYNDGVLSAKWMNGRLGIGNTNPSTELDVTGTTKTNNLQVTTGATSGHVLQSDASGNATWVDPVSLPGGDDNLGDHIATSALDLNSQRITTASYNLKVGLNTGAALTTGSSNNFIGYNAGQSNTVGHYNNFLGINAGRDNTTGSSNNFFGANAGIGNTTGGHNNFLGPNTGVNNTAGSHNNFLGSGAGTSNTIASYNNFFGYLAGTSNTTGSSNTFIGYTAGRDNTTGGYNTFIGYATGQNNLTGVHNFFVGYLAGQNNTTGNYNNFFGHSAGKSNTTGIGNNFFGLSAGTTNTTGAYNNFLGREAGKQNISGNYNTFMGYRTGRDNTTGHYNNFIGGNAGRTNTTGASNNFIGYNAGVNNTTGNHNNFLGRNAGLSATTATSNNFIGFEAGKNTTTGSYNTFIGQRAGITNTTGHSNNFIAINSGRNNTTGSYNNFIGRNAGYGNTTGHSNNFFGFETGKSSTTGSHNIAIGNYSIESMTIGNNNTTIGNYSGNDITSASNNTIIGYNSGRGLVTGSKNTILGASITGLSADLSNHIILADGDGNQRIIADNTGQIQLPTYTGSTHDGSASSILGVDGSGNIVTTNATGLGSDGYISDVGSHTAGGDLDMNAKNISNANFLSVNKTSTFRNGNTSNTSGKDQLTFGYNGASTYLHSIKTRHNAGGTSGNSLDFYTWDATSDDINDVGTQHVMSLDGDKVGIGTTTPTALLSIKSKLAGSEDLLLIKDNDTENRMLSVQRGGNGNANMFMYQEGQTDHSIQIASGGKVFFNTGQNFGIGTNLPTSKFHVETSSNNSFKYENGGSDLTPYMSIVSTSGKSIAVGSGTTGSFLGFDETGFFGITSESKANITNGTSTGGDLQLLIQNDGKVQLSKYTGSNHEIPATESKTDYRRLYVDANGNILKESVPGQFDIAGASAKTIDNNELDKILTHIETQDAIIRTQGELIEELSVRLENLEDVKTDLENTIQVALEHSEEFDAPYMSQNMPNPTRDEALIKYYVPEYATSATVKFFSLSGQVMQEVDIDQPGQGEIKVNLTEMRSGSYMYVLIINGELVTTKTMIVVK